MIRTLFILAALICHLYAQEKEIGNWTETFLLKDGKTEVVHTPNSIKLGHQGFIQPITFQKDSLLPGGIKLEEKLHLSIDLSRDQFINALINAGIYMLSENNHKKF